MSYFMSGETQKNSSFRSHIGKPCRVYTWNAALIQFCELHTIRICLFWLQTLASAHLDFATECHY
jgi:hypothetical protein